VRLIFALSRATRVGVLAIGAALLTGCGTDEAAQKIVKIILDPETPVGPPEERPTQLTLHAFASGDVNPNFVGETAPLTFKVVALKSDHIFVNRDFFSLTLDLEGTLGPTFVAELDEQEISPDTYKVLGPYDLPEGTTMLGILSLVVDIDAGVWQDTISVDAQGAEQDLAVLFLKDEVRFVEEGN
jgi:type VI secretion system protein VasD